METQKKTSPLKDIKSFFSPNGAGAGAPNSGAAKAKAIPSETAMPNKLDFAATAPVAGPEPAPSSSEPAAGVNPREALATVANGVAGAANPAANRRDSDLTAPSELARDGNSPAPSVGFTTPAHGLRAAHAGPDPADTPLAIDADAVRRAIPPRRAATSAHREAIADGVPRFDVSTIRRHSTNAFSTKRLLFGASLSRARLSTDALIVARVSTDALIVARRHDSPHDSPHDRHDSHTRRMRASARLRRPGPSPDRAA